jgi:hypothetical protein
VPQGSLALLGGAVSALLPGMISSEPFAWNVLVEDQYRKRQEQAETAEQRDRGKRIYVGDRCCRRAREQPRNGSGHMILEIVGALWG